MTSVPQRPLKPAVPGNAAGLGNLHPVKGRISRQVKAYIFLLQLHRAADPDAIQINGAGAAPDNQIAQNRHIFQGDGSLAYGRGNDEVTGNRLVFQHGADFSMTVSCALLRTRSRVTTACARVM